MIKKKEIDPEWIESTVKRCISEVGYIEEEKIELKSSMIDDLGMDSLDGVELIMACEEEFNICIEDEEAEKVHTVQEVIDLVTKKLEEQNA